MIIALSKVNSSLCHTRYSRSIKIIFGREDGCKPPFNPHFGHKSRPDLPRFQTEFMVGGWGVSIEARMSALGQ
jgi:hypothetical protein